MRLGKNSIGKTVVLVLTLAILGLPALAQHGHEGSAQGEKKSKKMRVGKKGEFTLTSDVRVGDALIPAGAYVFSHVVEGQDHVVSFKKTATGREVARVKCKIEPIGETADQTLISTTTNEAGERTILEIVVAGENVKHVF